MKSCFCIIVAFFFCGCYTQVELKKDPNIYEGIVRIGFEVFSFRSCGSNEAWWIGGTEEACEKLTSEYESITHKEYEDVYARLRGKPGEKGQYGHLNAYDRTFFVQEIIVVRPKLPSDCH